MPHEVTITVSRDVLWLVGVVSFAGLVSMYYEVFWPAVEWLVRKVHQSGASGMW